LPRCGGGGLFSIAADPPIMMMAYQLSLEELRCRVVSDDGVAADADAGGLADPELGELSDGFVSQCRSATTPT
jgi:hypothetical protein